MHATVRNRVATIGLNRPMVLNCVDEQWVRDFHAVLDSLAKEPDVRVVILRAEGRAFCTGIDLTALSQDRLGAPFFRRWEEALRRLETMDSIVVAAIHSHCLGGGLQLALAADLRIAREDARFGVTAVREGIIPGLGMWRIARHAGLGRAKRLALTAEVVDAGTAYAWGLVDYVAEASRFEERIADVVDRLLAMARTSTRLTKHLIARTFDSSFDEMLDVFCQYQRICTASAEHREAMAERRSRRPSGRTTRRG